MESKEHPMRIGATIAPLAMFSGTMALAGAFATPASATETPKNNNCYWHSHKHYCNTSRLNSSSSTELFPTRCNGVLGFWYSVDFANGETFCIARSTADFYHNGNLVPTCTVTKWSHTLGKKGSTTTDVACPSKQNYTMYGN